jgi:predicted pyridoxine 5'-phosphate oxidase superfamily flavin-nucleotide-binding protein
LFFSRQEGFAVGSQETEEDAVGVRVGRIIALKLGEEATSAQNHPESFLKPQQYLLLGTVSPRQSEWLFTKILGIRFQQQV